MTRAIASLILATTVLRLILAAALGLGVDESYMVAAGRVLSLGYYDHPPAAWWLSWGMAHLLGSEAPIGVRMPFIALFALSTWLMFRLGAAVADARAGFWAAVLLNLSPVFGVTTGTWVLPDGPLDCALLGSALCIVHALERDSLAWWLGAGACAGLALFSKYSAVLIMSGVAIYLLSCRAHRRCLGSPKPWLALLVAVLIFAPVVAWNVAHDWVSFAFQADRADLAHFRPFGPLVTLAGEALFLLPWLGLPMMVVFAIGLWRGPNDWRTWLLCCLAAPPIVVFTLVAAWSGQRVLFHWAAPGYLMLFPLLGAEVAQRIEHRSVRRLIVGTAGFVALGLTVIVIQVHFDWLHALVPRIGGKDPDLEAVDWTSLRARFRPGTVVGVPDWRDAGKLAYALGPGVTVLCLNQDSRQFGLSWPAAHFLGSDMLIAAPEHADRVVATLGPAFDSIQDLPPAEITHPESGRALGSVAVFFARRLRVWPPER